MPRGHPPGYVPVAAIKAAARLKHERMLESLATGKRWCPACRQTLVVEAFAPNRAMPSGLSAYCRTCLNADKRRREARRRLEAQRQAALADAERYLAELRQQRAAERQRRRAARAAEDQRRLAIALACPVFPGWVTRCCGGVLRDGGPELGWVVEHRPGCKYRWSVSSGG
jgi:hypothetical protein